MDLATARARPATATAAAATTATATATATAGDFDAFVASHHRRLVGILMLHAGSQDRAEELAQESLIKLLKNWDQVRRMSNPWAWLATVAINLSRSRWRRKVMAERLERRLPSRSEACPDHEGTTELLLVVGALPHRQRTALLLRHYAGLSVRDAAAAMGCAEGTVKSLTSRAIERLRTDLSAEINDADD
jgi:RNA polymerase sigma-70 factor (sigma-E family)